MIFPHLNKPLQEEHHLKQDKSIILQTTSDIRTNKYLQHSLANHLHIVTDSIQHPSVLVTPTTPGNYPSFTETVSRNRFEKLSISVTLTGSNADSNIEGNTTQLTMTRNIVSALMEDADKAILDDKSNHRVMLLILIIVFMVLSLTISVTVIVLCKKKNSVFMLQKCEQDSELEMDDLNEDEVETSDSEYEDIDSSLHVPHRRSETYPCLNHCVNENEKKMLNIQSNELNLNYSTCAKNRNSSKNRNSINRNKIYSGSPTSVPLLQNSNLQTDPVATKQNSSLQSTNLGHCVQKSATFCAQTKQKQDDLVTTTSSPYSCNKSSKHFSPKTPNCSITHLNEIDWFTTSHSSETKLKKVCDQSKKMCVLQMKRVSEAVYFTAEDSNLEHEDDAIGFDGKLEIL